MVKVDRSGYTITEQTPKGGQTTYRVNRDSDGAGLGAFADDAGIDEAIKADRKAKPRTAAPKAKAEAKPVEESKQGPSQSEVQEEELAEHAAAGEKIRKADADRQKQAARTAKRVQAKKAAQERRAK